MCDNCGDENVNCNLIGVYPPDMIARVLNHSVCPVCEGYGLYRLPHFKHPRPCPICKGTGQTNIDLLPSKEAIAQMLMYVLPPRITPIRPVPEGNDSEN
jgi:hypothetical protein